MHHRLAIVPAALLLVLTLSAPVLAKWDVQARLDAPIHADAAPGTTLVVGWTTTQADGNGGTVAFTVEFTGAPVFIALTAPGAPNAEALVFGDESPAGSGHYTASIVVPPGGIAPGGVSIGLRGTSCEAGVCQYSDLLFELVGVVLEPAPGGAPVAVVASPPPVDPAGAALAGPAASPGAADVPTGSLATLAVAGVIAATVVLVVVAVIGRRRDQRLATD